MAESAIVSGGSRLRAAMLAVGAALCLALVYFTPVRDLFHGEGFESLRRWVQRLGPWGPASLCLLGAAFIAVGVPRLLFAALGGSLFGWLGGTVLAQVATMLGGMATFVGARHLGRDYAERIVARRFPFARRALEIFGEHGVASNVLIRVMPVGNYFLVNILMSLSPIRAGAFLAGTFLGTLPQTVICALLGSAVTHAMLPRLVAAAVLLGVLLVACKVWGRRSTTARELRAAVSRDAGGAPPARTPEGGGA